MGRMRSDKASTRGATLNAGDMVVSGTTDLKNNLIFKVVFSLLKYARSRHYGMFYLQNLKVFILRILKNSVGKVDDFACTQK